jgi:hypothetical protein
MPDRSIYLIGKPVESNAPETSAEFDKLEADEAAEQAGETEHVWIKTTLFLRSR